MTDYLNYLVCVIEPDGNEIAAKVDEKYHKHIQAFREIDKNNEQLHIKDYIKHKGTDNITGYELASFLGAEGNVVFFHTDVSNYKNNKRQASIIIPESMTESQKTELRDLYKNLEKQGFSYYITQTRFKNNSSYKLVHNTLNLALFKKLVYNVDNREGEEEKCKSQTI